jgi:hypothetical protein
MAAANATPAMSSVAAKARNIASFTVAPPAVPSSAPCAPSARGYDK